MTEKNDKNQYNDLTPDIKKQAMYALSLGDGTRALINAARSSIKSDLNHAESMTPPPIGQGAKTENSIF